jgi:hypothetical protein
MGLLTDNGGNAAAQAVIREEELNQQGLGNFKALINITHPKGLKWNNPELYETSVANPDFDPYALTAEQVQVPFTTHMNEADEGRLNSMEDVKLMQQRYKTMQDSYERTSYENMVGNMLLSLPIEALNPVNIPEILVIAASGGQSLAVRIALGAGTGAFSGYKGEQLVQENSGYIDEAAQEIAGIWGASLGGGFNAAFGMRRGRFDGMTDKQIEDQLVGSVTYSKTKNDDGVDVKEAQVFYRDEDDGLLKLRKAKDSEIPEIGNKLAWGMIGRMNASKSPLIRQMAAKIDVSGTSKGLVKGDTGQYIKELGMRNHMSTVNDITGAYHEGKKAGNTMTLEEFNIELKHQFDRSVNGHAVAPEWKASVDRVTKWAKTEAEFRKSAGFKVAENYTPRALDVGAIRNADRATVLKDIEAAMYSAADKGAASKAATELNDIKQKIITLEHDLIQKGARTRNVKVKGKTVQQVVRKDHPALQTLYKERAKLDKGAKGTVHRKKVKKEALKFLESIEAKGANHNDIDSMKKRKYDYDESMMAQYMHQDMSHIIMHTGNRTAGRIATTRTFGITSNKDLDDAVANLRSELQAEGILSRRQIESHLTRFKKSMKDLHGTLMHPADGDSTGQLIKRFMMNANFATMGGGFFATALQGEAALVLASGSLRAGLKGMGIGMREFRNLIRGIPMKGEYARKLQIMSYAFDVTNHSSMGRFLDADFDPSTTKHKQGFEKVVGMSEVAAERVGRWTGLTAITSGFRMAIAHTIIDDIFHGSLVKMAKNGDIKKFERLQIDAKSIKEIQTYKDKAFKYNKDGSIKDINLEVLPAHLQKMVDRAVSNASRLNILSGDKKHLPGLFSRPDDPFSQIFTQFLSFPVQAWDSLLLRGMTENKAKIGVAVISGVAISSLFALMNEEMKVQTGMMKDRDRKYDLTTDEGMHNLGINAFKKGSMTASLSLVMDVIKPMFTGEKLGSTYRPGNTLFSLAGPTAGRLEDYFKTLQSLDFNPFDETSNSWKTVYGRTMMLNSFVPAWSLPIVGDAARHFNNEAAGKGSYLD